MVRDVGLAEDLAQDALLAALEKWPGTGIPGNPGAWLMATAKHRAIDQFRREKLHDRKEGEVGRDLQSARGDNVRALEDSLDDTIGDDLLRLVFTTCHPVLATDARIALTLRLLGGLTTGEIARAFLVPEPTVAQRIVRAKRALAAERVPFELPAAADLPARLGSVLEVVYLVFNEGYVATAGPDWTRPELCGEALRLARVLAGLLPAEPEVLGLLALLELQASRLAARTGPDGEPVLLADQDRRRWDRLLLRRGLAALERAEQHDGAGRYVLQAQIAACHARAASVEATDWPRVAALYTVLAHVWPSPVVEVNRAVATGYAHGPERGLAVLAAIDPAALPGYPHLEAVRGDLLERLGRPAEAAEAFERAAGLTHNDAEGAVFSRRAGAARGRLGGSGDG
jgi:RNA polymerase sigma factor (sigma-70 family)